VVGLAEEGGAADAGPGRPDHLDGAAVGIGGVRSKLRRPAHGRQFDHRVHEGQSCWSACAGSLSASAAGSSVSGSSSAGSVAGSLVCALPVLVTRRGSLSSTSPSASSLALVAAISASTASGLRPCFAITSASVMV